MGSSEGVTGLSLVTLRCMSTCRLRSWSCRRFQFAAQFRQLIARPSPAASAFAPPSSP